MENITSILQTLKIDPSMNDIDMSNKYGIIILIHNTANFTPHSLTFDNIKLNIHRTSILLKNNQVVIFDDTNPYKLQYEISTIHKILETDIRNIVKTEFGNINLYCVVLNSVIDISNPSYEWYHLYDFIDCEIYKYNELYSYLIDSYNRDINHHLNKNITINYSDNNLDDIYKVHLRLGDIYKCLV